jgi:hypothetical protein
MTVEERAFKAWDTINEPNLSGEQSEAIILQALRDQIEDCAKLTDDESIRLDYLGMGYKQRGDLETATRYSACIVTAAKLGREIRALAGQTEQTEGKEGKR